MNRSRRKVLLVGWDAADWKVIRPMVRAGKLPHLARLMEQGISGNMATLQPMLSPMLWTSIATGKRAYKHGIYGFTEPDPLTGGIRPVTNLSRKTKAVWNILNQNELRTIVVGWWPSNPAEELSRGIMVANGYQTARGRNLNEWRIVPGTIHPNRLEATLAELHFHPAELSEAELRFFLPNTVGMSRDDLDKVEKDPRVQSLMKIIAEVTSIQSAATFLIQNEPWDFAAVYFDGIDHFGHSFMRYHPPQQANISDWDFRVFQHCLEAGYCYHDLMLGALLELAGDETTVIVVSDHGFHPDHLRPAGIPREPTGPTVEHRQLGIFIARGSGLKRNDSIYGASLLDVCPTLLHLFDLPVGEDMDGKVLLDIYEHQPAEIQRIASWDEVEGDHGMHPPDKQISAADSKAALQQLVDLGYIAQPDDDRAKALEITMRELDYNLAQAYLDSGVTEPAMLILERIYTDWPMEHRFGVKLAFAYHAKGRIVELRKLVTTLGERRLEEGRIAADALAKLRLDEAEVQEEERDSVAEMSEHEKRKFFSERQDLIARAQPNLLTLRFLEACADFAEKKFEQALSKLEVIESDFGARRNALLLRGEICVRLKRWQEAQAAFEQAIEMDPEMASAFLGLARVALARRDYEMAARRARESIELLFFQPRAHYIHGLAQYRLGNWKDAESIFLLCARQAPLYAPAFRMLGEIARWDKKDIAEQALYQMKAQESRRRAQELRSSRNASRAAEAKKFSIERVLPMPRLNPDVGSLTGLPAREIITVVSGLPRSGTSLMMQIVRAAGIPAFTDGKRAADKSNQKGYFEHEAVASLLENRDHTWLRHVKGHALKVIAPLLVALPASLMESGVKAAPPLHYRVVFMERDMGEILHSQAAMLERMGKSVVATQSADIAKVYREQERLAKNWCIQAGIPALSVDYHTLVHSPDQTLPALTAFLGASHALTAMRACIDASLHRVRQRS